MGRDSNPSWPARCWKGLITPSALSGLVAITIFVVSLVSVLAIATPERLAEHGVPILLDDERDHSMVVTAQLLRWRLADEGKTRLLITGSSPTRHSLDIDTLTDELQHYGLEFDEAADLTLGRQTGPHLLAILDNLPDGGGILVVGINPTRLLRDPGLDFQHAVHSPPLGVRSDAWDALGEELGYPAPARTGIFLWDNRAFFLPRFRPVPARLLYRSYPEHLDKPYIGKRKHHYSAFRIYAKQFAEIAELTEAEREERLQIRLDIYRTVVERAREEHGYQVVFYRAPMNPAFNRKLHVWSWTRPYWDRVEALADELDVPVIVPPKLGEGAFYDQAHLRSEDAMKRASRIVARKIGDALGRA